MNTVAFRLKLLSILGVLLFGACSHFDELNVDPNRMNIASPGTFINPVLYNVAFHNWGRANSFTNDLMQVTSSSATSGSIEHYVYSDGLGDGTWNSYYGNLMNILEMERLAIERGDRNYQAIAITLKSWMYHILVDCFGNIPMSEALRADDEIFRPKFDNQQEVYLALINDLDNANSLFDVQTGLIYNKEPELLFGARNAVDPIAINKWRKFCNSVRLRILLRALDTDINAAAEIREMFENPDQYPLISSNEEAASLVISGVAPQLGPYTRLTDFYIYGREIADFFVSSLNTWNDPRCEVFCYQQVDDGNGNLIYRGRESGLNFEPDYETSGINRNIPVTPLRVALFTYAEIEFIKAELALKNIVPSLNSAEAYNKGVQAAIEQWGKVMPAGYLETPGVMFDGTFEQLMLQKYYALTYCDYQQWFEYNRTGLPALPRGPGVSAGSEIAHRFKYPAVIQRMNADSYQAAVNAMGGDEFDITLFWHKENN
ncbi:SusD/RagB family nutrient-binding outer membrane lipoprotein [Parapedobacter koreensis]|uniref:Starch-binding associating with outer membrane n=1 Tax=Parapedobacter koreensis TaxID=332977 RepID=A0A1H7FQS8_9SPHI|nr:SusD/RagB family nutrient-binding outer membrane lipoprotein [Parapedobacter koreensis]SEK26540.1 Starch-binding associating with outer membrane [Parapedobacter koreensis]